MKTAIKSPYRVGLIGAGIQASRTPSMLEHEAAAQGMQCGYQLIDLVKLQVGADALPDRLKDAEDKGFAGLNITFPCKQTVLALLDDLSDDARTVVAATGSFVGALIGAFSYIFVVGDIRRIELN